MIWFICNLQRRNKKLEIIAGIYTYLYIQIDYIQNAAFIFGFLEHLLYIQQLQIVQPSIFTT
jgi:hypothetical protein